MLHSPLTHDLKETNLKLLCSKKQSRNLTAISISVLINKIIQVLLLFLKRYSYCYSIQCWDLITSYKWGLMRNVRYGRPSPSRHVSLEEIWACSYIYHQWQATVWSNRLHPIPANNSGGTISSQHRSQYQTGHNRQASPGQWPVITTIFLNRGVFCLFPCFSLSFATHFYLGHKHLPYATLKPIKGKIPCSMVQIVAFKI